MPRFCQIKNFVFPLAWNSPFVYDKSNMKHKPRRTIPEWTVTQTEAGLSLQEFLAKRMKASKRVAKQHIDARVVRVNGQSIWMARHTLKPKDVVTVAATVASPTAISKPTKKIPVLYEDADYIVVDKPRNMLTHRSDASVETTLRIQQGIPTLQASHRLDRNTTGCLLFSKTQDAHEAVIKVFKRHDVIKTYRTVVHGRWKTSASTIDLAIGGKRALTQIRCIQSTNAASHLVVRIETGRTHQIRRHLAMARHPVIGDLEYGPKTVADEHLRRLTYFLLHAVELEMEHPRGTGTLKVFAPVPQDFHRWLNILKLGQPK